MSVTTERIRTPKIRTPEITTVAATRQRRGGWAIVVIALALAVAAALVLLSRPTTDPAAGSGGRAEQASQIWSVKAAQAPFFASNGSTESSTPSIDRAFDPATGTSAEWAAKAAYGRARQAAFGNES